MTVAIPRLAAVLVRRKQFLTFCAVGASGVLVNMAVFEAVLAALHLGDGEVRALAASLAAAAGWAVSVATNFLLNDRLTFGHRAAEFTSSRRRRMARYYATASSGLGVQLAVLNAVLALVLILAPMATDAGLAGLWSELTPHRHRLGNLVGIGAGTVLNYLLSRHWVFR